MNIKSKASITGLFSLLAGLAMMADRRSTAATLEVGAGKAFVKIEDANAKARPGDVILIFPPAGRQRYERTAVMVRQANLTFRGVPAAGKAFVAISGHGFEYSGAGSVPRAIFQFNPDADHCIVENLELFDAHNASHNGAGVRINGANHAVVRNCSIHGNDMGIMSNGDGTLARGVDQRIERCLIYRNGSLAEPGQNHNLYLGGTSVTLRFCEVYRSLTGHNVKSRANYTRVEYCFIHHSANREFDLVDAAETARPESDAVLLGDIIVKDPKCPGNHGVIHFGQDGGKARNGTLYLEFNTIVTPFMSPVIDLSASGAKARLDGNILSNGGVRQAGQKLAAARNGAGLQDVSGQDNWFCGSLSVADTALAPGGNHFEPQAGDLFLDAHGDDYRLVPAAARRMKVASNSALLNLPVPPGMAADAVLRPLAWQYRQPAGSSERRDGEQPLAGALELGGKANRNR